MCNLTNHVTGMGADHAATQDLAVAPARMAALRGVALPGGLTTTDRLS